MDPSTTLNLTTTLTLAQTHLGDLRLQAANARLTAGTRVAGRRAVDAAARRSAARTLLGGVWTRLRAMTADRMVTPSR